MLSYGYPRSLDRVRSLWGLDPDGLAATPHPFCLSGQFVFERYRSVTKAGKFSPSIHNTRTAPHAAYRAGTLPGAQQGAVKV